MKYPSIAIITDPNDLWLLQEEWNKLYDKADKPYFTESFEWNWCCWQKVSEPRGDRLHCVVVRCEGQTALIWPLVLQRRRYFWSVLQPLAVVSTEYSNVLVDAGQDGNALMGLVWQAIIKTGCIDLIELPHTRADSLLYPFAESVGGIICSTTVAPYVAWGNYPNWNSYYRALGKSLRSGMGRRFRRLSERGVLRFEMLGRDDAYQEELQWLIQTKQNWVTAKKRAWSPFSSSYLTFLSEIIRHGGEHGRIQLCILKLDDKPIAGQIMRIDETRVEFVIASYDPSYSSYSLTQFIHSHCMQWAFERHLTVDYRLGDSDYKRNWKPENCKVVSYDICSSHFGKAFLLIRTAFHKAKMLADN